MFYYIRLNEKCSRCVGPNSPIAVKNRQLAEYCLPFLRQYEASRLRGPKDSLCDVKLSTKRCHQKKKFISDSSYCQRRSSAPMKVDYELNSDVLATECTIILGNHSLLDDWRIYSLISKHIWVHFVPVCRRTSTPPVSRTGNWQSSREEKAIEKEGA